MPATGELVETSGTFIDGHGHETTVVEGQLFPACEDGDTWWWHEELPIAKQMRWEAQRPPRPGGLRDLIRERLTRQGRSTEEIEDRLRGLH